MSYEERTIVLVVLHGEILIIGKVLLFCYGNVIYQKEKQSDRYSLEMFKEHFHGATEES